MVPSAGVPDLIKSLNDLQDRFGLRQAEDDRFFTEWVEDLPQLDDRERTGIDLIKQRYNYHRMAGYC